MQLVLSLFLHGSIETVLTTVGLGEVYQSITYAIPQNTQLQVKVLLSNFYLSQKKYYQHNVPKMEEVL